jgi:UDPglucose 6-dehydrogenase
MNILIFGAGYVGYPLALMLNKNNPVDIAEVDPLKIEIINLDKPLIEESEIQSFFNTSQPSINAIAFNKALSKQYDIYIIATPTNYDEEKNYFDTTIIEDILEKIDNQKQNSYVVIKSTVPIGFTSQMRMRYRNIILDVCPEFIREGVSFYDNNHPSRIVISDSENAQTFIDLVQANCEKTDLSSVIMSPDEAESVKLFANTYLALRVSYFNELDNFAISRNLNTKKIISGVSSDPRIGNYYNNPSFGYGGYCLPKDTKQLKSNFADIPSDLIQAVIDSNDSRKKFIADEIIKKKPQVVGVYRVVMKEGSNNFRSSSILDVLKILTHAGIPVIIYEPVINEDIFLGYEVLKDINIFNEKSDVIISNRVNDELAAVQDKVYSRDIFNKD